MTSFGSHHRNTDRSLKVSISSYRHRSDLVRCRNGSGETIVVGLLLSAFYDVICQVCCVVGNIQILRSVLSARHVSFGLTSSLLLCNNLS